MAKKSSIAKNKKRQILAERNFAQREALRKLIKSPYSTHEQREEAITKLNKMRRDTAAIRVRNRCLLTGRCRAYLRHFKISRLCFRELASQGAIPGVVKASW